MKRQKSDFEKAVLISMIELGYSWKTLAPLIGEKVLPNNLNSSVRNGSISGDRFVNLCKELKKDAGEMYKLKEGIK
tara:strand:- start:4585 stop:4812 length:228 start_codon:yes stop_codon:yes gene_type:complete